MWPPMTIGIGRCTGRGWASTPAKSTKRRGARGARRTRGVHRVEELVGDRAALLEVGADGAELGLEVADADAEREPAAAEHVEAGDLLGQHDGVALREDHDAGREADRRVRAAAHVRASSGSSAGSCGAIGDGGTCGSGRTTCSPAHSDSNPAASAAAAASPARRAAHAAPC